MNYVGIGIIVIFVGIIFVGYAMSQTENFEIENRYLVTRGSVAVGVVLLISGGLIMFFKK